MNNSFSVITFCLVKTNEKLATAQFFLIHKGDAQRSVIKRISPGRFGQFTTGSMIVDKRWHELSIASLFLAPPRKPSYVLESDYEL